MASGSLLLLTNIDFDPRYIRSLCHYSSQDIVNRLVRWIGIRQEVKVKDCPGMLESFKTGISDNPSVTVFW